MYLIERFSGCWNHQKLSGKFKFLAKNEVLQLEFFEKPLEKEDEICDLTFEIHLCIPHTRSYQGILQTSFLQNSQTIN